MNYVEVSHCFKTNRYLKKIVFTVAENNDEMPRVYKLDAMRLGFESVARCSSFTYSGHCKKNKAFSFKVIILIIKMRLVASAY